MKVLIAIASKHGSTWEIAETIGSVMNDYGIITDVRHVEEAGEVSGYDAVIIGSAVYMGRWMKTAQKFVEEHTQEFWGRPVWLFSSGPVGNAHHPPSRHTVDVSTIATITEAQGHKLFSGKVSRRHMDLGERIVLDVVRAPEGDFREWGEICAWASGIAQSLTEKMLHV